MGKHLKKALPSVDITICGIATPFSARLVKLDDLRNIQTTELQQPHLDLIAGQFLPCTTHNKAFHFRTLLVAIAKSYYI